MLGNKPKKKSEKLYDMPFEKRIRIKYTVLGFFLCLSIACIVLFVQNILTLVGMILAPEYTGWQVTPKFALNQSVIGAIIGGLSVFFTWMLWYDKSKIKKHPELDETVGLKTDWDKVNSI